MIRAILIISLTVFFHQVAAQPKVTLAPRETLIVKAGKIEVYLTVENRDSSYWMYFPKEYYKNEVARILFRKYDLIYFVDGLCLIAKPEYIELRDKINLDHDIEIFKDSNFKALKNIVFIAPEGQGRITLNLANTIKTKVHAFFKEP